MNISLKYQIAIEENTMNSRERVIASLNHQEPDMVPFDLGGTTVTSISTVAYQKAMAYRNIPFGNIYMHDMIQQIVIPSKENLDLLGVDTIRLGPPRINDLEKLKEEGDLIKYVDEWLIPWQKNKSYDFYFNEVGEPPFSACNSLEELKKCPFPDPADYIDWGDLISRSLDIPNDKALVVDRNCAGLLEMSLRIRGYAEFYSDMAAEPELAEYLLDKVLENKMRYWESILSIVGQRADVVSECDDLGSQQGLLISRDMYRSLIKPRQKKLFAFIKSKAPNAKLFYHSCGAVSDLIPDFIDVGIDILNPVQTTAAGMAPEKIKKEFGRDIVFWGGGINTQVTLPRGTQQQVRDEVKRAVEALSKDGGYIFASIHNIQADVPPENFWAMIDEFQKIRGVKR